MNRWIKPFAILLGIFAQLGITNGTAYATPGDYDGDGLADLAIIDADDPEAKTTFFVRQSSNNSTRAYIFHPFGDIDIAGDFYGDGKTYPGIVSTNGAGRPLAWKIRRPNGKANTFTLGIKGDKVPNQTDIDCDGKADFIVVHKEPGGSRTWKAKLTTNPSVESTTSFGNGSDQVFTGDVDGDGCSEIIALSTDYVWSSRQFSGDPNVVTQVTWGQPGDFPMVPIDVTGDDLPDYIVVRKVGGRQVAFIHSLASGDSTVNLGPGNSVATVGNFFGSNTFGWFDRNNSRFVRLRPNGSRNTIVFGNPRRGLVRPDGTEVPEGKTGQFGKPAS